MEDKSKVNVVRRRIERLKDVRSQTVTPRKIATAAVIAGGVAMLTLYLILLWLGVTEFNVYFALFAAGLGMLFGLGFGAKTPATGAAAGALGGIWIFFELIVMTFVAVIEVIAAVAVGVLSGCG